MKAVQEKDTISGLLKTNNELLAKLSKQKQTQINNQQSFEKRWRLTKSVATGVLVITILIDLIDLNKDIPASIEVISNGLKEWVSATK